MRDSLMRRAAHKVATSQRVEEVVTGKPQLAEIVDRFTAGDHPAKAVVVALDRYGKGMDICFAQPLAHIDDRGVAERVTSDYLEVIQLASAAGIKRFDISFSLPSLGMVLGSGGPQLALDNARRVIAAATAVGATATVEMGPPEQVDLTLDLVRALRAEHPALGLTLQASLRRTVNDLDEFLSERNRVRLVKGAHPTSGDEGWDTNHQIDRAYVRLLRTLMESPALPLVATHDPRLVSITHELVRRSHRTKDDYEFQMLMGIRPLEHRRLVDTGRRLRVYIPYGDQWFDYLAHQLTEQPRTLGKVVRQLVSRR